MKSQHGAFNLNGFQVSYSAYSHKGMVRNHNEDNFLILPKEKIFCVADGVGGLNKGEEASRLALNTAEKLFRSSILKGIYFVSALVNKDLNLAKIFKKINKIVYKKNVELSRKSATTLVVARLMNSEAIIAHIGDSRAYIWQAGVLKQITEDHSVVTELIKQGIITKEEGRHHPQANIITRAIGIKEEIEPDINKISFGSGDIFLLCTDGLTDMLDDQEINILIQQQRDNMKKLGKKLIDEANKKGGKDNITVIVLRIS